jgi:probable rRNA maturation factor
MSQSDSTVLFRALPDDLSLSPEEKRAVRSFARKLGTHVANGRPFTCVLSDDAELRRLNNSFLGHDYPTDVLSFPSHSSSGELGELIVSVKRAEAQASEFGHGRIDEICILMLHGVLHLCGMDHEKDHEQDRGQMANAEQKWREDLGLPVTLIARSAHRRAG